MTYERVRSYLRQARYSHHFANIPQIIYELTQTEPKRFTEDQKQTMVTIFMEVQEPYERHKINRTNFLSYSYVLYKICELLGYNDFLPLLHKLSNKILLQADYLWKLICDDLRYEYIPTV